MATHTFGDGNAGTIAVELPPAPGRLTAAASRAVVLSSEDLAEVKHRGSYTTRCVTGTGVGTQQLMAAAAGRIHAIVQNPSSNAELGSILLAFGANAAAANGFELKPGDPPLTLFTVQEIRVLAPSGALVIAWELA